MNYTKIARIVAEEWKLPENIINGIKPHTENIIRKPHTREEYLSIISSFTNEITDAIGNAGDLIHINAKLKTISKHYAASLLVNYEDTLALIQEHHEKVREYSSAIGIDMKNTSFSKNLFLLLGNETENEGSQIEQVTEQEKQLSIKNSNEVLTAGIASITNQMFKDYKLNDLLMMVMETIYKGFTCTHVMICLKDSKSGKMKARLGYGENISSLIPRFQFSLSGNNDLFNNTVKSHTDIVISNIAHSELKDSIPDWCQRIMKPENLLIYPIVANNNCIGLIYADSDKAISRIPEQLLPHFDTLRNQTTMALKQKLFI